MKHFYFLLVTVLFLFNQSFAQTCLPDGITFTTQQQIDNFATNYPGCTTILGDVLIQGDNVNAITSLNGLIQLTSIEGDLEIFSNDDLTSLTGLENLIVVDHGIKISANNGLTSLAGLENLTSVNWSLIITNNNSLISLAGLENLTFIGLGLQIRNNENLTSLTGLENLPAIGELYCNAGGLRIQSNINLVDLTGLNNVTVIYGNVRFQWNASLINFTGLDNVTSIGSNGNGDLDIVSHSNLTSLTGLHNINYDDIVNLRIEDNVNLVTCGINNICDYLANGGLNTIANNATNCSTTAEVLNICTTPINTPDALPEISIFPNPNTGVFEISGIAEGDYTILNTAGQIIQRGELSNDLSVDISAAPQGVYFISITVGQGILVRRMVKI